MAHISNPNQIEPHSLDGLLDPHAASAFLGMSPITLCDWRSRGGGPTFLKVGRYIRYRLSDLNAWLDSRSYTNTSEAKGGR